jgi:hypothetical protein
VPPLPHTSFNLNDQPIHAGGRRAPRPFHNTGLYRGGRNITGGPEAGDGRLNPDKDDLISGIFLTDQEQADIVAFLRSLTDLGFLGDPALSDPFSRR